jgi:glycyl-tRNA synthetase
MVIELSSLAGTMAREYALRAGEPAEVAQALAEMEQPRTAGGALPVSVPGALLALADRLDLLAGLFAIGANPTGSSDPFALRRATLGVVSILRAFPQLKAVTLSRGLAAAAKRVAAQGVDVPEKALADALEFSVRRYEQQLLDASHEHRLVQAVLPLADIPADADATLAELERLGDDAEFAALAAALQRARRIVPADTEPSYDSAQLTEAADVALREAVEKIAAQFDAESKQLGEFVGVTRPLVEPVNTFLDTVHVMADDQKVRAARLGLLATVNSLADGVLDWRAL